MKKRFYSIIVCFSLLFSTITGVTFAKEEEPIIILYENDVHCAVDGYSKFSALKKELSETYEHVGAVSCGDFVQGGSLGIISQGEYIVKIMNLVGYDAVALGNHEFDYRISRLLELTDMMDTKPVCCNFKNIEDNQTVFDPYKIVSYGDTDIAYIGITTPTTISSSSPAQFKDDQGNYIYSFSHDALYDVIQKNIDSAEAEGADYIIALSHIGYDENDTLGDITDIIENTDGFDVILDAHSHSVIDGMKLKDKSGDEVLLTSTGTKFEYIGKLTIAGDEITSELIKTESYEKTDEAIDKYIAQINEEYAKIGERKIAVSEVALSAFDADGTRLVRNSETNLGNLCSDAFRLVTGADIGYSNGGGLRADIPAGDITFNNIINVFPFNNQVVVAEVTGQDIKDMLELAMINYPAEDGSFPHLSGLTFSFNKAISPSVKVDEHGMFIGVDGEYRVYDIKVLNSETGAYEPIQLDKTYRYASINYFLLEYGGGMSMFKNAKIVENNGMLDAELLEKYILENLGGVIGSEYAEVDNKITFTDGFVTDDTAADDSIADSEECLLDKYTDLDADAWYHESAEYVLKNGLMNGSDDTIFSPDESTSRAMAVTVLWRMEGSPVVNYAMNFSDVENDSWYTEAVRWATSQGIVNGYSDTLFAPNDLVTREQLASIMWRYAKSENVDVSVGENTDILSYSDISDVSEYAMPALKWTCGTKIMSGNSDSTINPKDNASRIQLAAVIHRYCEAVK